VHAPSWIGPGLAVLFVVPLLVYGAYSIGDRWYQNYLLTQQEEAIRAEVMRLREENLRLQRELVIARSDAGIEKVAREHLGLIKPGDTPIQIVGPGGPAASAPGAPRSAPTPAPAEPKPAPAERPAWLRFLDGLFRR
jgi:cell division protein FtsB